MSENTNETVRYFYWISGDFSRKLAEPKREYFDGGYRIDEYETGTGFLGETVELSANEVVTRIGLMNYAMARLINSQNEGRAQRGCSIMFDKSDLHVKAFDCGRNEL